MICIYCIGCFQVPDTKPPPCKFHKDDEYHQSIINLCSTLEIINRILRLAHTFLSAEKIEKLCSLGVQMAYKTTDPKQFLIV